MVAAPYWSHGRLVPTRDGTATHLDGWRALQRLDDSEQGCRTVHAVILFEPRTEIGDLKGIAVRQRYGRGENIRIGQIDLTAGRLGSCNRTSDGEMATLRIQQTAESRRAVRSRQAHPLYSTGCIDQGGNMTISDEGIGIH